MLGIPAGWGHAGGVAAGPAGPVAAAPGGDRQHAGQRGVAFASLHEGIDTSTSTGRLVFHIFAALAEFERELIAERAVQWQAARARGRVGALPPKLSPAQIAVARARYEARDVTVAEIARALGVGRGTIYRALQQAS